MPRNGAGSYSLPTGNPVISNTVIASTWWNTTGNDISTALTQSLTRDGQAVPTANLPMAGFRFTGVGLGASLTDLARVSQVQDGSILRCSAEMMPTQDVYTANLPFGATTFNRGQIVVLVFPTSNLTTTPTLNINSSAAWPILRDDGSSIQVGDLRTAVPSQLMWNSTNWLLLGTSVASGSGVSSFNSRFGAVTLLGSDITTALGYTPVNKAGDTFTGPVSLAGDASTSLQPVTLQQMLNALSSLPTIAGVTSFNTRAGTVTLTTSDVTAALGFSPVQSFNGRTGVIALTNSDVLTALGYTPVQSFNTRTGAVTLTSLDVTNALGFTPATALGYTPVNKAGDTMIGPLNINGGIASVTYEREAKIGLGSITGSTQINWNASGIVTATVAGSGAAFTFTNLPIGLVGYMTVDLTNGGVASSISSLFSGVKWPGGASSYALSTSGRDIITLMCHDGSTVNVVGFANAMS
jgi:hypothetical protein